MITDKWHNRYFKIAAEIATWSKDPSTKIGAVCVGSSGQILSQGYNGFPRGIDDLPARLNDRETKYSFTIHAEMNCIYNASLSGISLNDSTLYVYGLPICHECAKGVVQSGIKKIYCTYDASISHKWADSWLMSKTLFTEAGVQFQAFNIADVIM
jgi:dCMP deaminase